MIKRPPSLVLLESLKLKFSSDRLENTDSLSPSLTLQSTIPFALGRYVVISYLRKPASEKTAVAFISTGRLFYIGESELHLEVYQESDLSAIKPTAAHLCLEVGPEETD